MASVTLKDIVKIYPGEKKKRRWGKKKEKEQSGDVLAVSDFNLEIKDKEFLVLVGPSGCGKSTTLRMIAGLEEITEGELYIGDKLVNYVPAKDRDLAMVFQSYALYPHMTVFENMGFALKLAKVPKDEMKERVQEAAEILEIEDLLDRKPKALSGGQRQRVALGRAIVRKPRVFLMDEPLSNLDAKLRVTMRTEIAKLHQNLQTTFVYVTHDQTEAMTMGDRIVVMKDGYMQQCGTPEELYQAPTNKFVAEFIGSPQMNIFSGTLTKDQEQITVETGNTNISLNQEKVKSLNVRQGTRDVHVGIRPEDFYVEKDKIEKYTNGLMEAKIELKETLGSEIYLYLSIHGIEDTVVARVTPNYQANVGDTIDIVVDTTKVHVFDKETEKTLAIEPSK